MSEGWIKLHRKILENPIANRPEWAWVWVVILLKANHESKKIIFNGQDTVIEAGSFITGRKQLAKDTCTTEQTIRSILDYLEANQQITRKVTNKFTVISVCKYAEYQNLDKSTNQPVTSQQPTRNQPVTTNNNDKTVKNDKKNTVLYGNYTLDQVLDGVIKAFNTYLGTSYKQSDGIKGNVEYWLKTYTPKEIEQAIANIKHDKWWRDKMTPTMLFRRKNPQGEPVDYLSQLLVTSKYDRSNWTN